MLAGTESCCPIGAWPQPRQWILLSPSSACKKAQLQSTSDVRTLVWLGTLCLWSGILSFSEAHSTWRPPLCSHLPPPRGLSFIGMSGAAGFYWLMWPRAEREKKHQVWFKHTSVYGGVCLTMIPGYARDFKPQSEKEKQWLIFTTAKHFFPKWSH